jgi:hypothetical protein
MKIGDNSRVSHWRQLFVDALVCAATLAVAFAAIGTQDSVPSLLLIAGALIGVGLMLEPSAQAQLPGDVGRQNFDPALIDAASA